MAIRIVGDPLFNFFDVATTVGSGGTDGFVRIANLKSLTFGGHSRGVIDVTSWDEADDVMKSLVGQIDPGNVSAELFYDPSMQTGNPTEVLFNEFQVAAAGSGPGTPAVSGLYRMFKQGAEHTLRHRMEISRVDGTNALTQDNITYRDVTFKARMINLGGPDVQQGDAISASLEFRLNSLPSFANNTVDDQPKRGYTS